MLCAQIIGLVLVIVLDNSCQTIIQLLIFLQISGRLPLFSPDHDTFLYSHIANIISPLPINYVNVAV